MEEMKKRLCLCTNVGKGFPTLRFLFGLGTHRAQAGVMAETCNPHTQEVFESMRKPTLALRIAFCFLQV